MSGGVPWEAMPFEILPCNLAAQKRCPCALGPYQFPAARPYLPNFQPLQDAIPPTNAQASTDHSEEHKSDPL